MDGVGNHGGFNDLHCDIQWLPRIQTDINAPYKDSQVGSLICIRDNAVGSAVTVALLSILYSKREHMTGRGQ
jgi:hypothetical protein